MKLKMNKRIKIFCYLHCAGWPFQSDLIYRNKKIDLLFVSGVDQLKLQKIFKLA